MNRKKISAFIITFNEEDDIERCLKGLSWADEIIVVDSFSSDNTVDICRKYTNNVYQKKFSDFADMKNYALSLSSGDWSFGIDADEEVAPGSGEKIKALANDGAGEVSGYYVKRKSRIFGRWFNYTGTQDDHQMRFFKTRYAKYIQPVHEKVLIGGSTAMSELCILHYTYNSLSDYIERLNRYTSMEAIFLKDKGCRPSIFDITVKPFAMFMRLYFFKQGFRDGVEGLLFSVLSGFYVFVKNIKLYQELKIEKKV